MSPKIRSVRMILLVVVPAAALTGCFQIPFGPIPFQIPIPQSTINVPSETLVTIPVFSDSFSAVSLGVTPGVSTTVTIELPASPIAPEVDIAMTVAEVVGAEFASLIEITSLTLNQISSTATAGDFSTLEEIRILFQPKPLLGVPQPRIELGASEPGVALGTTVMLQPPPTPVDFLVLIDEDEANPETDPALWIAEITGAIPAETTSWDIEADLTVGVGPGPDPGTFMIEVPICDLPSFAEIDTIIQESAPGLPQGLIQITSLALTGLTLQAVTGDFSAINAMTIEFVPKPVDGVTQDPIVLGVATLDGTGNTTLDLSPPTPVNFLALLAAFADNPTMECASLRISITGFVPFGELTWDTNLELAVSGVINLMAL